MHPKILAVGSLAFDIIFSIPGDFRKSIPLTNGKIRNFNATYVANEKKEFPGGTAGNIAFWLGQEKTPSTVFSAWGKDLSQKGYEQKLKKLGAKLVGPEGTHTAHAYIVSDSLHQQLIIWQPNAYEKAATSSLKRTFSKTELTNFKYAIFSAGTPSSIEKHLKEFRETNKDAIVIFDPGQVSQFFTKEGFKKCCELANVLVGNDIEFQYFATHGIPKNIITIETLGSKGADIKIANKTIHVPAKKVSKVVETTGAGDAFRAGLLSSLAKTITHKTDSPLNATALKKAVQKGVLLGAECVKIPSAQF